MASLDEKLAGLINASQKDQSAAYCDILNNLINAPTPTPVDIKKVTYTVANDNHVAIVVGRQVIIELVRLLEGASSLQKDQKIQIIRDTLESIQPRIITYEEQAVSLRFQLAALLEEEEEWSEAAKVLMAMPMDSGRFTEPEEKLKVYIRIVRLLLEEEDSVQAETYYNRAGLLIHSSQNRETQLQFKLCQARISDYSRKFVEAAARYHELSWATELDDEDRMQILSAGVTCAVLAPAGPSRSRVLASLCRDDRTAQLPNYTILSKMFLEHILRPNEVKGFEESLKPHQLAKIAQSLNDKVSSSDDDALIPDGETVSSRTGPSTVLDRAVMEHNLLSCSKIYNNITFSGLGALLDLAPGAAENMARRMIEQGRLKAHIDQVARLITFDPREDEDAQGKAGGLGDVNQEAEDTGAPYTKKWDQQIRKTASHVEEIVQSLHDKGLVGSNQYNATSLRESLPVLHIA